MKRLLLVTGLFVAAPALAQDASPAPASSTVAIPPRTQSPQQAEPDPGTPLTLTWGELQAVVAANAAEAAVRAAKAEASAAAVMARPALQRLQGQLKPAVTPADPAK